MSWASSMPLNAVEFHYFNKVYFCHYLAFMTAQTNHHLCQGGIVSFVRSSVLRITLKVVDEFPFNVFWRVGCVTSNSGLDIGGERRNFVTLSQTLTITPMRPVATNAIGSRRSKLHRLADVKLKELKECYHCGIWIHRYVQG